MEGNKVGGRWQEMQERQDRGGWEGVGKGLKMQTLQEEVTSA